jgi:hypothetical protein
VTGKVNHEKAACGKHADYGDEDDKGAEFYDYDTEIDKGESA